VVLVVADIVLQLGERPNQEVDLREADIALQLIYRLDREAAQAEVDIAH